LKKEKDIKLAEKLFLKKLKLNSLLEITTAINENEPEEELLALFYDILTSQLGISRVLLYFNDKGWNCLIHDESLEENFSFHPEDFLVEHKDISQIKVEEYPELHDFEIIIPVYHNENPLACLLIGGFDENKESQNQLGFVEHIPFIQTLTNIIVVAIENKRLVREAIEQAKMMKELEFASQMQEMLLPVNLPKTPRLELAGYHQPHNLVGGDYYDYLKISEDQFVICIADVSGKGVSAALLMANFQASLRAIISKHDYFTMTDMIQDLNAKVMDSAKGEKFITLFVAYFDFRVGMFKYINAGHNPPVMVKGGEFMLLDKGSVGLGMFDTLPSVEVGLIDLDEEVFIQCYTDGIVEQENEQGEFFEMDRLKKIIADNIHLSCDEIHASILSELNEYRGSVDYVDDVTMLNCRVNVELKQSKMKL
jgi:phosphoserine phosphatase RsbU/P